MRTPFLAALLAIGAMPQQATINQRPADATVAIANSHRKYDGTFSLSYRSRVCGEIPPEASITGERVFVIEFPDDGATNPQIGNISFGSKILVGGVKSAQQFMLNVSVRSPQIGAPSAYVLDTDRPKNVGTATLTQPSPGTTTLKVVGSNDMGETIDLIITCKPA